jgi:CRISPR-associated endoribonuclease Cas6
LRVKITLLPINDREQEILIPLDFRHHFISLLKSILSKSQLFKRFEMEAPGYSPYAFSVTFKDIVSIDGPAGEMLVKTPVYVTISTGLFDAMTEICNGAIKMHEQNTVLGLKIKDVQLMPLIKIKSSQVIFKTIGHAVFRVPEGYLNGDDLSLLEESINYQLSTKAQFLDQQLRFDISPDSIGTIKVLPETSCRKGVCLHYGGKLTTLQGFLYLEGSPETLQFLYDYGIGSRGGQGFGLLEVVRQI